jgi:hypothetical protein
MTASPRLGLVCAALAVACQFDSGGIGHGSGLATNGSSSSSGAGIDTSTSGGTTFSGSDAGTSGVTTDPATTTSAADTMLEGSSDGAPTESGSTTNEMDPCAGPPPFMVTIEAAEATLSGSMMLGMLGNGQQYVYSEDASGDAASFSFHTDCPGDYWIWGYVYDSDPLILDALGNGADRMQVALGEVESDWHYGCTTGVSEWSWQEVGDLGGVCLGPGTTTYTLDPGEHTVAFAPSEGGMAGSDDPGDAAALQRITITNDPDFSP